MSQHRAQWKKQETTPGRDRGLQLLLLFIKIELLSSFYIKKSILLLGHPSSSGAVLGATLTLRLSLTSQGEGLCRTSLKPLGSRKLSVFPAVRITPLAEWKGGPGACRGARLLHHGAACQWWHQGSQAVLGPDGCVFFPSRTSPWARWVVSAARMCRGGISWTVPAGCPGVSALTQLPAKRYQLQGSCSSQDRNKGRNRNQQRRWRAFGRKGVYLRCSGTAQYTEAMHTGQRIWHPDLQLGSALYGHRLPPPPVVGRHLTHVGTGQIPLFSGFPSPAGWHWLAQAQNGFLCSSGPSVGEPAVIRTGAEGLRALTSNLH